jgi:ribosomal protection tetracycline resistance protein
VGEPRGGAAPQFVPPPAMEAVAVPVRSRDHVALREALARLAEQDPLINVRADARDVAVSLYGEVQKEVIAATLAHEFGIDVTFREATPLYIERPTGVGEAAEILNSDDNPFRATIGLRVEPAAAGSGIGFRLEVDFRTVPLSVFRTLEDFGVSMERYVCQTLREGLYGWPVSDCLVTMTKSNYSSADGPPSTRGPLSSAADFRKLTPLVLMRALQAAGTAVCEPMSKVRIETPAETVGALMPALSKMVPVSITQTVRGSAAVVVAVVPAARVQALTRELPGLTSGEGVLETDFAGYQPLTGGPVRRRRATADPLNRKEYLASL